MGTETAYDSKRYYLEEKLNECLKLAKELVTSEDTWGYKDMKDDYAMNVYIAVKKARDSI